MKEGNTRSNSEGTYQDSWQAIEKKCIPFNCDECEKSFSKTGYLKYHKEIVHENIKRYFCIVCQKGFHERQLMLDHLLTHDDGRKPKERFLTDESQTKLSIKGHFMFERSTETMHQVCLYCKKIFRKVQNKLRHEKIHEKKNIAIRNQCRKKAKQVKNKILLTKWILVFHQLCSNAWNVAKTFHPH